MSPRTRPCFAAMLRAAAGTRHPSRTRAVTAVDDAERHFRRRVAAHGGPRER
ncbi:hypothetical protein BTM25_47260 [Actinomadura rubteroloni]|uniref:Uncharacterized protein n=1 Tax=Actinomadura rubteroloni TaxID=1926885 RepID=A0A2P4UEW0_9ACTN|nr:hypothetical protein BTM25_47260 [Actinomadura rubteroloni]